MTAKRNTKHSAMATYVTGYVLSIVLTLLAYFGVTRYIFTGNGMVAFVMTLAVIQLVVQLMFFLHLGQESKPRWNLLSFIFMLVVLVILVFGSIWIMYNLNYHDMSPQEINTYIQEDEGIH